jgi:hypothetical protein
LILAYAWQTENSLPSSSKRWCASRCAARLDVLEQARAAGEFTPVHGASWAAVRKARGDAEGNRALIAAVRANDPRQHRSPTGPRRWLVD